MKCDGNVRVKPLRLESSLFSTHRSLTTVEYDNNHTKNPQVLAEMCQSGYKDALRFLQENSEYTSAQLRAFSSEGRHC